MIEPLNIDSLPAVRRQEPMSRHTTFKIGGPAEYFFVAKTKKDIVTAVTAARTASVPYLLLGRGSNVLVADAGIKGLVISVETAELRRDGTRVMADAGVSLGRLATWTVDQNLRGAEFLSGIPGSIGGSIRGNAGAMGRELKDIVMAVEILSADGQLKLFSSAECRFAYRDSHFKHSEDIILSAIFQLEAGQQADGRALLKEYMQKRGATQDYTIPSAGCMFKNPAGQSAGQLIDQLGFKGRRVGDAVVSPTHANFITNVGRATADQVIQLVTQIKQAVREKYHVELETEVQFVGF